MTSDEELIARVRERHTETESSGGTTCYQCFWSWPCPTIEALDTLARRLEELEEGLKQTVAEENTTPHHHRRAATWDDNGKPCQRCLMFDRARSLLHPESQEESPPHFGWEG